MYHVNSKPIEHLQPVHIEFVLGSQIFDVATHSVETDRRSLYHSIARQYGTRSAVNGIFALMKTATKASLH